MNQNQPNNTTRGRLHFLGIAGHAMRGIASTARDLGYEVTGTDEGAYEPALSWLKEQQIEWWDAPDSSHLDGVSRVIISGHTAVDHLELLEAQRRHIPIVSYPELIAELTASARRIVVAGTHGKTSTTALIAWILESAGRKPDFLVGIQPHNFSSSVRMKGADVVVIEGDEYRASSLDARSKFAFYKPDVLVLTSIEMDHPDLFADLAAIRERFEDLVGGMTPEGQIFYWNASSEAKGVALKSLAKAASYDLEGADWEAKAVKYEASGLAFELVNGGKSLAELKVPLYGAHNVLNTLAAAAVALGEGISVDQLKEALLQFKGASRRFERVSGNEADVTIIDDYAHHPTEVKTTIEAVRLHSPGRIIAVFQPHTYSRTIALLQEYHQAFTAADLAYIAPIEGAREKELAARVSGADIAKGASGQVEYVPDRSEIIQKVTSEAKAGDIVLVMSVNGFNGLAAELNQAVNKA